MRLAVISDIHGNLHALEAVLADIAAQGVDATLSLGDFLSGPGDPAGVADRLMALDLPSVRGNHDRYIVDGREQDWHIDVMVRDTLNAAQMAWLAAVPATQVFEDEVLLCHGTPRDDNASFLDGHVDGISQLLSREHIEREAEGFDQAVIVCGHTHVPRTVRLGDGRLVVNPGAVGLPFEIGSPDARYGIIEKRRDGWNTELRAVAYDHVAAARLAEARGYPKWAEALMHGWASPRGL